MCRVGVKKGDRLRLSFTTHTQATAANKNEMKGYEKMKASELIRVLETHPDAEVVVMANEDYEDKKSLLTPYVDIDGRVVIQFWE